MDNWVATLKHLDNAIAVLKQFSANIAAAASAAIKELADKKADVVHSHMSRGTATIPSTGWKSDNMAGFPYYYDLTVSGLTADDRIDMFIDDNSADTVLKCGMYSQSKTLSGKVRVRARTVPSAAISLEYYIMK